MKGILLASGEGTRLRPLTDSKPKVMMTIGERPVLEYNLKMLTKANIKDIIINLYHQKDAITGYFGDGNNFGVKITYSHEDRLYGTAGAVKRINCLLTSSFVVGYGDNLSNCDLVPIIKYHKKRKTIATVVLYNRERNRNSDIAGGCARLDLESSRILEFVEGKGSLTNYVNAGIYILEPKILNYIPKGIFYDFGRDLFPLLLAKGIEIYGYIMPDDEYLFGIDTIESYKKAEDFYEKELKGVS